MSRRARNRGNLFRPERSRIASEGQSKDPEDFVTTRVREFYRNILERRLMHIVRRSLGSLDSRKVH